MVQIEQCINFDLELLCFLGTCVGRWSNGDTVFTKAVIKRVAPADILAQHADPICTDCLSCHPYSLHAHLFDC